MEVRQLIRTDITASAIAHLAVLSLVILFTQVHPFGSVTPEPITVDLVTPDEVAKKPEPDPAPQLPPPDKPLSSPDVSQSLRAAASPPPTAASPPPAPSPQEAGPNRKQAALQPQAQPQPQPQAAASQSASPGYTPQPDLTVKYHVMLGLPGDLPPIAAKPSDLASDNSGDGIDARSSATADVKSSLVAAFRRHLRTCSKLPASVSASDNVMIKLRVLMTPDAKLAAEPILIEGTASEKGVELKQSAVKALSDCQPYGMLPADRYGEWKVLDLTFTPQDFTS